MDSSDLKKMLVGLCLSGLLAGSGVGVTASHASGG
jgi:radical SAM modification target selenobiotic family peptide